MQGLSAQENRRCSFRFDLADAVLDLLLGEVLGEKRLEAEA